MEAPVLHPTRTIHDLQDEFLPDVRPVIDVSAGSRVRLLVQMVLAQSETPLTIPALMDRCEDMQGPDSQHTFGKQAAHTYRAYARKWLASEGLAVVGHDETAVSNQVGRNPALFASTEKGRKTLPALGALATFQIRHDVPLAKFWGSAPTGNPLRPSSERPYPNHPTGRLRIIQSALFGPVTSSEFVPFLGHGATHDILRRLVNDDVLTRSEASRPIEYAIRPEMTAPTFELLLALCSLRDDAYRAHAEAAAHTILGNRQLTAALLRPFRTGPDLTKEDVVARQPLTPSLRLPPPLRERVGRQALSRREKVTMVRGLLELQALDAIAWGPDGTCDFVPAVYRVFQIAERRALAEHFGIQGLVGSQAEPQGEPAATVLRPGCQSPNNDKAALLQRLKQALLQDNSTSPMRSVHKVDET